MSDGATPRPGLVDGLVEPDHILHLLRFERPGVDPQPEDGGAQRAILRDKLVDVKAAHRPQDGVRLRRGLRGALHGGRPPLGLLRLRFPCLRSGEVLGDSLEDPLRMVTEGERRHAPRGRQQGAGERLPLRHNALHTIQNELSQPHIVPLSRKDMHREASPHRENETIDLSIPV